MKKIIYAAMLLLGVNMALVSCQKAPYLTLNGQKSITFIDDGGTETISFTCNRVWSVKSSESWLKVSLSQGEANEEGVSVTITCDANTTYDPRTATITITSEGFVETVSVSQDTNYGLFTSPNTFELTNAAQNIEIEVQANVEYTVAIDEACKDWISQVGTKALSSDKLIFSIAANERYEDREGKITIREACFASSSVQPQIITVKQSQAHEGIYIKATAGDVKNLLSSYDCSTITSLKISGHIDASDFRFIKWNCINLEHIDISDVVIDYYYGPNGTNEGYDEKYPANEIPQGAFFYWMDTVENGVVFENDERFFDEGMSSLKSVKLPVGITAIRRNAFARAYYLEEINIPEGVEIIDFVAFRYCESLTEITLPSTIKEIGLWVFTAMPSLKVVHCNATVPPTTNQSFGTLYDSVERGKVVVYSYNTDEKFDILYIPKGCKDAYASWLEYFSKIEEE